ncbi:MAG: hypothetical protein JWR15_3409 [Prosthecobacter sp.]|nr:hypothetical protein [Prosthecobacter sp.]
MSLTATHLTPALILRELGKLNVADIEGVLHKLQMLAATKKGALKADEARLLEAINATLPTDQRTTYRRLSTKRKNGSLTPAEHRELLQLSDLVETLHARRVQSLVRLAALRKTTVPQLMERLGLESLTTHA